MEATQIQPPDREDRGARTWLIIVTVIAVAAAGLGGYALSEATKEEKPDDTPLRTLRVDFRALETELKARVSDLEGKIDKEVSPQLESTESHFKGLDDRVTKLEKAEDAGDTTDLEQRIDDLEQRISDLETEDSGN